MKIRHGLLVLIAFMLLACSKTEEVVVAEPGNLPGNGQIEAAADTQPSALEFTEEQVEEYIRLFLYQDTYDYAKRYTAGDPSKLNIWVLGGEPSLVKAGEDRVVRMNNDTFYKMSFVDLIEGPVYIAAKVTDESRFVSFQLMDDRNVNYHNIIYPNSEFTLYYGEAPENLRGEGIAVPSKLAVASDDGTYTFLFKQDCAEEDINCLEVPAGHFDVAARYYLPSEAIRSGDWVLPPFELAN